MCSFSACQPLPKGTSFLGALEYATVTCRVLKFRKLQILNNLQLTGG